MSSSSCPQWGWTTLVGMDALPTRWRESTILDHGINVDEIPQPHRLAERGW